MYNFFIYFCSLNSDKFMENKTKPYKVDDRKDLYDN